MKDFFNTITGGFWFVIENYNKRYPYVLLGEKKCQFSSGYHSKETVLLYRITGKRYIFECSAAELCNTKELIGKFHPLDVRIISFIAGVEQILTVPLEARSDKFNSLKDSVFKI